MDPYEAITAIAKTVAELTCSQDGSIRQQIIEKLMREIMDYDAELRRDDASLASMDRPPNGSPGGGDGSQRTSLTRLASCSTLSSNRRESARALKACTSSSSTSHSMRWRSSSWSPGSSIGFCGVEPLLSGQSNSALHCSQLCDEFCRSQSIKVKGAQKPRRLPDRVLRSRIADARGGAGSPPMWRSRRS